MSLRILFVSDNYPPVFGGMSRSAQRVVSHLKDLGHLVSVVSIRQSQSTQEDITFIEKQSKDKDTLHALKLQVETIIQSWKPDLLVGFYINFSGYVASFLGKQFNIPSIISARGNDIEKGLFNPLRLEMVKSAIQLCTYFTSVSQYLVDTCLVINPNLKYTVVYNGIKISEAHHKPSYNLGQRLVIGFFGDDRPKKGLDILIDAVKMLNLTDMKYKVIIGGKHQKRTKDTLQKISTDQIRVKVMKTLPHDDIDKFYSQIHVMVIPSRYEGFPNVLLEAILYKIPVIISNAPSLDEYFPKGMVHSFNSGSSSALCNRIQYIQTNYEAIDVISPFNFIKKNYSLKNEKQKWASSISEALNLKLSS